MSGTEEKSFDMTVTLRMYDYFRYYFSLFNMKTSGLVISLLSAAIIAVYSLSLFSLIYIWTSTGVFNWETGRGIVIDLAIIFLFSIPFIRTYLIAYKDAKTHRFLDKPLHIRITEDKFIVSPEDERLEYSWKKMYRILNFRHGFALFIDKKDLAFVLPKRCFKDKQQIKMVNDIILKHKKGSSKKTGH